MLQIKIEGRQYRDFVQYAAKTSDLFSLVLVKDNLYEMNQQFSKKYDEIKRFILKREPIGYHPDTGTFFEEAEIVYFECNQNTASFLKCADSIFDWNADTLPGELCFHRDGSKWFASVCHEQYLFVYRESKEDLDFFENQKLCIGVSEKGITYFAVRKAYIKGENMQIKFVNRTDIPVKIYFDMHELEVGKGQSVIFERF